MSSVYVTFHAYISQAQTLKIKLEVYVSTSSFHVVIILANVKQLFSLPPPTHSAIKIQGNDKHVKNAAEKTVKKSRSIFRRRGSRPNDEASSRDAAIEEVSDRPRVSSDDARCLTESTGKERQLEREVRALKECIAEKVSEIEQLRLRTVEQCTSMAQMEEDFTVQLTAMKNLCKEMSDEKERLEGRLARLAGRQKMPGEMA